jgi:hypothetical protein
MPKNAARTSIKETLYNTRVARRTIDKLWDAAGTAPMFCRQLSTPDKNGKVIRRSSRLIGGHAYHIAASGAASALKREIQCEAKRLGIPYVSSTGAAVQPTMSKGACRLTEQFIAAYCSEAIHVANRIMSDLKTRKRLNAKIVAAAFAEVNESIFASSGFAPRTNVVLPVARVKKGVSDGDAEFVAPEDVVEEAASDPNEEEVDE